MRIDHIAHYSIRPMSKSKLMRSTRSFDSTAVVRMSLAEQPVSKSNL